MRMGARCLKVRINEISDQIDRRKKEKEKVSVDFQVYNLYGGWW